MTVSYVYKRTEPELWTVGFYKPDGSFEPESDVGDPEAAARRVAWLNGAPAGRNQYQPTVDAVICFTAYVLQVQGGGDDPADAPDTWYTLDTLTGAYRDDAIRHAAHAFPGEPTRLLLRVTTDEVIWIGKGVADHIHDDDCGEDTHDDRRADEDEAAAAAGDRPSNGSGAAR